MLSAKVNQLKKMISEEESRYSKAIEDCADENRLQAIKESIKQLRLQLSAIELPFQRHN